MKKALIITLLVFFAIFTNQNTNAQTQQIIVDTTITSDCEIYPFSSIDTLQGLGFSGSVTLNSDSSLVNAYDSIPGLLQNENRLAAKYALVEAYLNMGDTVSVNSVYQSIDTDFELSTVEYSNWIKYNNWLNYLKEQISRGKPLTEPDSLQLVSLYQLYDNSEDQLKTIVRNLLRNSDTLTYNEPYLSIDTTLKQSKVVYRPVGNTTNENNELLVYPNPSNNYFIVDFSSLDINETGGILNVYTFDGKISDQIWINRDANFKVIDTRYWKSGVYVLSLQRNNGKVFSARVVVNH